MAYDEIATTKSYSLDVPFYRRFGSEKMTSWIKLVARDEAAHFQNCLDALRLQHAHRMLDIPPLLERIYKWDVEGGEYKATFVLDHDGELFTPRFLRKCCSKIIHSLGIQSNE